jgi:hypothetical protein
VASPVVRFSSSSEFLREFAVHIERATSEIADMVSNGLAAKAHRYMSGIRASDVDVDDVVGVRECRESFVRCADARQTDDSVLWNPDCLQPDVQSSLFYPS